MSDYRKSEVVSGLFITLAAVVFALFAFKVGRFDLMGLLKPEAVGGRAYFRDVKTLQVGSKVKVGGRDVGEVTGLQLVSRRARPRGLGRRGRPGPGPGRHRLVNEVTFELTYPGLRLDLETAGVTISQSSLLAPHFLELDPGEWPPEAPPPALFDAGLEDGTVFSSAEAAGLGDIMVRAGPAIDELTDILRTLNRDVLTPDNVDSVGRALGGLDQALVEGHELISTLNRGVLAPDNVEAVNRMVHNLDQAVADGRSAAARLDALLVDPRLDAILTDVAAASGELHTSLEAISADLQLLLAKADRLIGDTDTELVEATRRLREALWQGEMALRKIRANPAVLLFGDDETDLEASDLDLTEIRLRGRARPYEQRDERDEQ